MLYAHLLKNKTRQNKTEDQKIKKIKIKIKGESPADQPGRTSYLGYGKDDNYSVAFTSPFLGTRLDFTSQHPQGRILGAGLF